MSKFQQRVDVRPMLVWSWASIVDGEPTLNRHLINASMTCSMGNTVLWYTLHAVLADPEVALLSRVLPRKRWCVRSYDIGIMVWTSTRHMYDCFVCDPSYDSDSELFIWQKMSLIHKLQQSNSQETLTIAYVCRWRKGHLWSGLHSSQQFGSNKKKKIYNDIQR